MREMIITDDGRRIIQMDLSDLGPITQQEKDLIHDVASRPVEPDEECPPLTPEMLAKARRIVSARPRIS